MVPHLKTYKRPLMSGASQISPSGPHLPKSTEWTRKRSRRNSNTMNLDNNAADGPRRTEKDTVPMSQEAVSKLEVAFAEFKGQVSSDLRNLSHDVKNLTQAMQASMPRREHEREHEKEATATNERIKKLEGWQTFMTRQAWVQWAAGLTIGGTVFKRFLS